MVVVLSARSQMPAGAYDEFLPAAAKASAAQQWWTAADSAMPAWYLSHGAPPLLDDGEWMGKLFEWAQTLPKPKAILIVSAHWESAPLSLSATAANTPLVYDFGGFPARFYTLRYNTPEAGSLAAKVRAMMPSTEPVHQHKSRGLDHGAWIPLMVMYPLGDVPVLQLSLPAHDPERLMSIGARLRGLRDEGILVIGSGFLTHGTPFLTSANFTGNVVPSWSRDFDDWASDALNRRDIDALADFGAKAPGMPYAHPSVEHFAPLFITLGAGSYDSPVDTTLTGYKFGLSRRSFQLV